MLTIIKREADGQGRHDIQSQSHRTECWEEGYIAVPPRLEADVWACMGWCELVIEDGVLTGITPTERPPEPEPEPTVEERLNDIEEAIQRGVVTVNLYDALASAIYVARQNLTGAAIDTDDKRLRASGLYEDWAEGAYTVGDIRNAKGQTWECFQAHDTATYPDINPENAAWFTFWRPLHGTTPETARPFVPVQGAHDMYRAGEYMVYTDGKTYRCLSDTNFSPEEYPQAWESAEQGEPV